MKYLLGIVLAAAGGYFFILRQKPVELAPTDPAGAAVASGQTGEKLDPKPKLAPEGTFYLIERISIVTESGLVGVDPGTKLTLLKNGTRMRVTDGKNVFDVTSAQVTRDIDVAGRIYSSVLQQRVPTRVGGVPALPVASPRPVHASTAQTVAAPASVSRPARDLSDLRSQLSALAIKEARMKKTAEEIRAAYNSKGRTTHNGKHPGPDEVSDAETDFRRASDERLRVQNQIAEIQR